MEIFTDIQQRLRQESWTRLVALGSSNTERYMPAVHWLDVLETGIRGAYGRRHHCINSGISGETTRQALARFDRDVTLFQPAIVIVTLGGNDSNPDRQLPPAAFTDNLNELLDRILAIDAIPVLQTYYAFDLPALSAAHGEHFLHYMQLIRDVAATRQIHLCDHLRRWEALRQHDPHTYRYKLMLNPAHPNENGYLLMGLDLGRHFGLDLTHFSHRENLLPCHALQQNIDGYLKTGLEKSPCEKPSP